MKKSAHLKEALANGCQIIEGELNITNSGKSGGYIKYSQQTHEGMFIFDEKNGEVHSIHYRDGILTMSQEVSSRKRNWSWAQVNVISESKMMTKVRKTVAERQKKIDSAAINLKDIETVKAALKGACAWDALKPLKRIAAQLDTYSGPIYIAFASITATRNI